MFEPDMRHAGRLVEDDTLYVFWSKLGYAPERILLSRVAIGPDDWNLWQASAPVDLLSPAEDWEGVFAAGRAITSWRTGYRARLVKTVDPPSED